MMVYVLALRGAATLKARAMKEVWNIAAVIPVEKGVGLGVCGKANTDQLNGNFSGEICPADNFPVICNQDLLARGSELLKRTRKGNKMIDFYVPRKPLKPNLIDLLMQAGFFLFFLFFYR